MKVLLLLLTLSSCSLTLMNEDACRQANWNYLGQQDALNGYQKSYFFTRQEACSKFKINGNQAQYNNGHRQGLKSFCTYQNGINLGESDRTYQHTCPEKLERDFLRGYELGQKNLEIEKLKAKKTHTYRSHKKCFASFDCNLESKCRNRRCTYTGKSCFIDLDCDLERECEDHRCVYTHDD